MTASITFDMIKYFGNDVKRINHALKVWNFSKCIGEKERISYDELTTLEIAAILHDIGIHRAEEIHGSNAGKYQEMEGPAVAKDLLEKYDLDDDVLDRILYLIGNHHSYDKIDGIDFQILVEADFIVNAFEDELSKHAIETSLEKIFKTKTGISIVEIMYL